MQCTFTETLNYQSTNPKVKILFKKGDVPDTCLLMTVCIYLLFSVHGYNSHAWEEAWALIRKWNLNQFLYKDSFSFKNKCGC